MIAFIHIQKTGGTTLKYVLRRSFGGHHCDARIYPRRSKSKGEARNRVLTAKDLNRSKLIYRRLKSISGHLVTGYSNLDQVKGVRFYTVLRDPIKRSISAYNYEKKFHTDTPSLEKWLANEKNRNVQTKFIVGHDDGFKACETLEKKIEFVGLQEHYFESLVMLKKWIDDPQFDPRHEAKNMAENKASEEVPSEEDLNALHVANREDLLLYQFVLDKVWPNQVNKYGPDLEKDAQTLKEQNENFVDTTSWKGAIHRGLYWLFLPLISRGGLFQNTPFEKS